MFDLLRTRMAQGYRTGKYPKQDPVLPDRFKGLPRIDSERCSRGCDSCAKACPVGAIAFNRKGLVVDLGKCIFCGACERACEDKALILTGEYRLATRKRGDLFVDSRTPFRKADQLDSARLKLFSRSIRLRQVSAGGCNACEADVNVLNTLVFDLCRFGIQFVASPRHADGILITGPVTRNMELALIKTYDATPSPKIVIAVGACSISGGMFCRHDEVYHGTLEVIPVDLFIPGCPPHPYTILDGLLRMLGRVK